MVCQWYINHREYSYVIPVGDMELKISRMSAMVTPCPPETPRGFPKRRYDELQSHEQQAFRRGYPRRADDLGDHTGWPGTSGNILRHAPARSALRREWR